MTLRVETRTDFDRRTLDNILEFLVPDDLAAAVNLDIRDQRSVARDHRGFIIRRFQLDE